MNRTFRINKTFKWSEDKDEWLKSERGISFTEIEEAIAERLLDVRENRSRDHWHQRVFIVEVHDYPWVVLFEETDDAIILKTAYPNRKLKDELQAKKHAVGGGKKDFERLG
jgi:uncharacterized DUF497 family protein